MRQPFTKEFKNGLWVALYEYLIITMPVGIYVFIDAFYKEDWRYLYSTPEWSIATIFLSFISMSKYLASIGKSGRQVFEPIIGIIAIFILLTIIASTLNVVISIQTESNTAIACRIILFIISTFTFFVFMSGAKLIQSKANV